jgi:sugar phosphate isomerase/epimerase
MSAPLSVQLYSLREAIAQDLEAVIARVADIGYLGVEPFGGLDVRRVLDACQKYGLTIHSAHLSGLVEGDRAAAMEMASAYGIQRVIVPWHPPEAFTTAEGVRGLAEKLNEANRTVRASGMELGYHNHDFEFALVDGRPAYDLLLEHLDKSIFMELDTYWVTVAGENAAARVRALGERAPLLHIKDGPGVKGAPMLAVGTGVLDAKGIVAASAAEWLIVELDACATDMMTAIAESYAYMTREGLGRGRK